MGWWRDEPQDYAATALAQNLAEQLTAKLNASGMEAMVCDLFADLDAVIYDTLVDTGEEARPHHQGARF